MKKKKKIDKKELYIKSKIKWKIAVWIAIIMCFMLDIFEEGIMVIGLLLGWLLGIGTTTKWDIEREWKENKK